MACGKHCAEKWRRMEDAYKGRGEPLEWRIVKKGKDICKVHKPCLKGKICMSTSSRKLKWLFEENAQLRDHLRLNQT